MSLVVWVDVIIPKHTLRLGLSRSRGRPVVAGFNRSPNLVSLPKDRAKWQCQNCPKFKNRVARIFGTSTRDWKFGALLPITWCKHLCSAFVDDVIYMHSICHSPHHTLLWRSKTQLWCHILYFGLKHNNVVTTRRDITSNQSYPVLLGRCHMSETSRHWILF